jgi:hypothetical protein
MRKSLACSAAVAALMSAGCADAAELNYRGLDIHIQRLVLFPDADNAGNGVMLEAVRRYRRLPM